MRKKTQKKGDGNKHKPKKNMKKKDDSKHNEKDTKRRAMLIGVN